MWFGKQQEGRWWRWLRWALCGLKPCRDLQTFFFHPNQADESEIQSKASNSDKLSSQLIKAPFHSRKKVRVKCFQQFRTRHNFFSAVKKKQNSALTRSVNASSVINLQSEPITLSAHLKMQISSIYPKNSSCKVQSIIELFCLKTAILWSFFYTNPWLTLNLFLNLFLTKQIIHN